MRIDLGKRVTKRKEKEVSGDRGITSRWQEAHTVAYAMIPIQMGVTHSHTQNLERGFFKQPQVKESIKLFSRPNQHSEIPKKVVRARPSTAEIPIYKTLR